MGDGSSPSKLGGDKSWITHSKTTTTTSSIRSSSSRFGGDKSWIKHSKTTTTTVSISMIDGSRHLVRTPDEGAPDSIKHAGKAIGSAFNQDSSKQYMLSDEEIGNLMGIDCRKDHQIQICQRRGITADYMCADACCLVVCKYFATRYPSCV